MESLSQSDSLLMHKFQIFLTDQPEVITNDSAFIGKSSIPLLFVKNQYRKHSILFGFWQKLSLVH